MTFKNLQQSSEVIILCTSVLVVCVNIYKDMFLQFKKITVGNVFLNEVALIKVKLDLFNTIGIA